MSKVNDQHSDSHPLADLFRGVESDVFTRSPADYDERHHVPDAFRDRTFLESVPLATWARVLAAAGEQANDLTFDLLGRRLDAAVTAPVMDALTTIATVDADLAVENLFDLEERLGPVLPDSWDWNLPAREQIALVWVLSRHDREVAKRLAILTAAALPTSHPRKLFAGRDARPARWNGGQERRLTAALRREFSRRGLGEYIEVVTTQDGDRWIHYVIRPTRRRAVMMVNNEQTARAPFIYRQAVCDILTYDEATGRLELRVTGAALVEIYRRTLADVLFQDPNFFDGAGGWTLTPLQREGGDLLRIPAHEPDILAVQLRSCVWAPEPGGRLTISDRVDAFEVARAQGLRLSNGDIVEAKFSFRFASGGRSSRAMATVRPPNQLACPDHTRARIEGFFRSVGIFAPEAEDGWDLWRVSSGAHPPLAWSAALGCPPAVLNEIGYLNSATLAEVVSDRSPGDRLSLLVESRADGTVLGVSDDGLVEPRPTAVAQGFRLDLEELRRTLARHLRLRGGDESGVGGVLDLGTRALQSGGQLHVFLAYGNPTVQGADLGRALCATQTERVVLLLPRTRDVETDLAKVQFDRLAPPTMLLHQIACALKIEEFIDARERAPESARLVLDRHQERAWLDGAEIQLTPALYAILHRIVDDHLEDRITPTVRLDESGAVSGSARKTKRVLITRIADVLEAHGRPRAEASSLISKRGRNHRGYNLNASLAPWIG